MEKSIEPKTDIDNKKKKILLLIIFSFIVLIILNLLFPKITTYLENENEKSFTSDISSLDSGIENILENYGVRKEWQYKQVIPVNKNFTRYERVIFIPFNVPVVNIHHEILLLSKKFNTTVSSSENIKNQVLLLHVKYMNNVIETIKFITDPDLTRMKGRISLIIDGLQDLSELEQTAVMRIPEFNTFIIDPKESKSKVIQKLIKAKKDYFLLLKIRNKSEDEKYELAGDMDSVKISRAVKQLFRDFEKNAGVIYRPEDTPLKKINLIESEIKRYNKFFINYKDIMVLEDKEGGFKNFDQLTINAADKGRVMSIGKLTKDNFDKLTENILLTQKKGFKFVKLQEYFEEDE
jgi:polysaccharide deacetylase 2 family uncharacterized protein YibQ